LFMSFLSHAAAYPRSILVLAANSIAVQSITVVSSDAGKNRGA
jgi:hypothetical protein